MNFTEYYQYTVELPEGLREFRMQTLTERFSLSDLGKNAVSNLTKVHLGFRLTDPEYDSGVSVIEAQWSPSQDTFTTFFEVQPTKGTPATVLTPSAKEYDGTFYNVIFQFLKINQYLGTPEEFQKYTAEEQVMAMEDMLWKCECKLHSNDPSFYYQGMWEDLAKLDGTVFQFPGPKGDGVWRAHHAQSGGLAIPDIRITKHMAQIIDNFDGMIPEIRDKTRIVS